MRHHPPLRTHALLMAMIGWSFRKRFFAITGLYLLIGFWAAAVAAPGTIEGLVYMRPEVTLLMHLNVQPEIITQGLGFGAWLAVWMSAGSKTSFREAQEGTIDQDRCFQLGLHSHKRLKEKI